MAGYKIELAYLCPPSGARKGPLNGCKNITGVVGGDEGRRENTVARVGGEEVKKCVKFGVKGQQFGGRRDRISALAAGCGTSSKQGRKGY